MWTLSCGMRDLVPWPGIHPGPPALGSWNLSHWIMRSSLFFDLSINTLSPVLLPGKSHGWRSLVGCSPWGHKEQDTTERLHFHFSLSFIGDGNGSPLQCSCLENPRDEGVWWAAVYGVAQSRAQLKWLSSSRKTSISALLTMPKPLTVWITTNCGKFWKRWE